MGTGDWFRNLISSKKVKDDRLKKLKGFSAPEKWNGVKCKNHSPKKSFKFSNGAKNGMLVEDVAATLIQTAFRAYVARKNFRRLKGIVRLQMLMQRSSVRRQASTTLSYLHSWSKIQSQIKARRICMVTEGRIKQKKLENQLKLEAKLHDLELEWNGGPETMEEILARIHQREEAAVKREKAMAYAFSHQWRANSNSNLGPPELGKANWGWSWMDRWIAARPWESRLPVQSSPKKPQTRPTSKGSKNPNTLSIKAPVSTKTISPNGKEPVNTRRFSYPGIEKQAPLGSIKAEEAAT
ncbi:hypothetical protein NMG60_11014920 [Bertholletia excelsa]